MTTSVSADGRLTATLDAAAAGVHLSATTDEVVLATNYATDPSHEYSVLWSASANGAVDADGTVGRGGARSVKVTKPLGAASGFQAFYLVPDIPFKVGDKVTARCFVNVPALDRSLQDWGASTKGTTEIAADADLGECLVWTATENQTNDGPLLTSARIPASDADLFNISVPVRKGNSMAPDEVRLLALCYDETLTYLGVASGGSFNNVPVSGQWSTVEMAGVVPVAGTTQMAIGFYSDYAIDTPYEIGDRFRLGPVSIDAPNRQNPMLRIGGAAVAAANSPLFVGPYDDWAPVEVTVDVVSDTGSVVLYLWGVDAPDAFCHVDDVSVTLNAPPVDFSGDTAAADPFLYRWTGTPGASASEQYVAAMAPDATGVDFYRGDGTPVRSGFTATLVGGYADAYDAEAPLGAVSSWYAVPVGDSLPPFEPRPDGANAASGYALTQRQEVLPKHGSYEAWPVVYETPGGAWLLAYKSGSTHLPTSDASAIVQRSTDGGATWSVVADIGQPGVTVGGSSIAIANDGSMSLITLWNTSGEQGGGDDFRIYRSTDDGLTWAEQVRYSWPDVATHGVPITLQNGDLLASYHGNGWGMVRSTDNGLTWTITSTANGGPWAREARMVQADDGTLVMIARNGNLDLYYSYDDGASWTQGTDSGIAQGSGNENMHDIIRGPGDRVVLVWISRVTSKMYRTESTLSAVLASPGAWAPSVEIGSLAAGSRADLGYPTMLWTPEGRLFLGWYEDPDKSATPSVYTATLYDLAAEAGAGDIRTGSASLFVPAPGSRRVWLKSVSDPTLSVEATVAGPVPDMAYASKQETTTVLGSPFPVVSFDGWTASTSDWLFYASTSADFKALRDCLSSGVVLLQTDPAHDVPDMYVLAGGMTRTRPGNVLHVESVVSTPFTEVERPAPDDAPLIVPGHSWDDFLAAGVTWEGADAYFDDWADAYGQ